MFSLTESEKREAFFASFHSKIIEALRDAYESAGKPPHQQLADELGVSQCTIKERLDGSGNMTLREISDLYYAMGQIPLENYRC